jgi:hypothetical protein
MKTRETDGREPVRRRRSGEIVINALTGILLGVLATARPAAAVVVSFDDLTSGLDLTGSGYAGLTWEVGNAGLGGHVGYWVAASSQSTHPHSAPLVVTNAWGCTEIGIGFPSTVDVHGAYIAAQGDPISWTPSLTVEGYLGSELVGTTTPFTNVGAAPVWFDMNLSNVDRIVFQSVPVHVGAGWFGMDDLTFTYIPEPASLPLLGLLGVCFLRRRRWRAR